MRERDRKKTDMDIYIYICMFSEKNYNVTSDLIKGEITKAIL